MEIAVLAGLGLVFGSFINALVERIHNKKSFVRGRSYCDHCKHSLSALDLIPIISWLALRGRCRYCKRPVSIQNPLVEFGLALVLAGSYHYWPSDLSGGEWLIFTSWAVALVGLIALLVYDWRFMLLPNRLIYPTLFIVGAGRLAYIVGFEADKIGSLKQWGLSLLVASGFFWLIYVMSKGRWIGFGDVRLGWITGTLLADPANSLLMIFIASFLGTIYVLPILAMKKTKLTSKVPFGPFLIAAAILCMLFGGEIIGWYKGLVGL